MKEQASFQAIQEAICSTPTLRHADPAKPYFLKMDASGAAMGAVQSHRQEDGCLHPIAFMAKSFTGTKTNYDTHDKELLTMIKALEEWRFLLESMEIPILVCTNHSNLEYWQESCNFNWRHARWHLLLADYLFKVIYRARKQSGKPDALSQRADHLDVPLEPQTMLPTELFKEVQAVQTEIALWERIIKGQKQDESLGEVFALLQRASTALTSVAKGFKGYAMGGDILMYRGKILVPDDEVRKRDLIAAFHDTLSTGHPGQQHTLKLVSRSYIRKLDRRPEGLQSPGSPGSTCPCNQSAPGVLPKQIQWSKFTSIWPCLFY